MIFSDFDTETFNIGTAATTISGIVLLFSFIRYLLFLSHRDNDSRYILVELFYSLPLCLSIAFAVILNWIPFILINTILYLVMSIGGYFQNIQHTKEELKGATGCTTKVVEEQKARFRQMNVEEVEEYMKNLDERRVFLGWRYEIKPIFVLTLTWIPSLVLKFILNVAY